MLLLLLLLLPLLWGTESVRGQVLQAWAGDPTNPRSPAKSQSVDDRYKLQVQSVTVQEGLCVFIPCTFSYPPDGWNHSDQVLIYWFQKEDHHHINHEHDIPVATNDPQREVKKETKGRFQLVGDPQDRSCSLVIRNAQKRDKASYVFRVERGSQVKFNFMTYMLHLNVTDLTQKPHVYIPETLEPGHPVTLLCVFPGDFEGCPAPTFSWSGAAVSSQEARPRASFSSMLTLTPRPQHHNTQLTCQVAFSRHGMRTLTTSKTVQLNVAHAPKDIVISISSANPPVPLGSQGNISPLQVQKGQFLRLLCVADSQPLATLSWVLGDRVLSRSLPSGSRTLELQLPRVGPEDAGRYTCRAENRLGSRQRSLDLSVQYPPENLRVMVSQANRTVLEHFRNGMSLPVLEGQSLCLICVADGSPPATLSWVKGSRPERSSATSDPRVLELPWVQKEDEGDVTCEAQNLLGSQRLSLHLSVFSGTLEHRGGFVQAAFVGAGLASLLFLCFFLIFLRVKTRRKKATKTAAGKSGDNSVSGTIARGHRRQEFRPDSPPYSTSQVLATPTSEEEGEVQYASIVFHGQGSRETWDQEAPSTDYADYAEITISQ